MKEIINKEELAKTYADGQFKIALSDDYDNCISDYLVGFNKAEDTYTAIIEQQQSTIDAYKEDRQSLQEAALLINELKSKLETANNLNKK